MKTVIYTEDSDTVDEEQADNALTYYQGSFRSIRILANKLSRYSETDVRILTSQRGILDGHDEVDPEAEDLVLWEDTMAKAEKQIFEDVQEADAIAFLLPQNTFRELVLENWSRILELSQPDTLWCFSSPPSLLEELDIEQLEERGDMVLVYERVGVARIDNDTRDDFIKQVQIMHRQSLE